MCAALDEPAAQQQLQYLTISLVNIFNILLFQRLFLSDRRQVLAGWHPTMFREEGDVGYTEDTEGAATKSTPYLSAKICLCTAAFSLVISSTQASDTPYHTGICIIPQSSKPVQPNAIYIFQIEPFFWLSRSVHLHF